MKCEDSAIPCFHHYIMYCGILKVYFMKFHWCSVTPLIIIISNKKRQVGSKVILDGANISEPLGILKGDGSVASQDMFMQNMKSEQHAFLRCITGHKGSGADLLNEIKANSLCDNHDSKTCVDAQVGIGCQFILLRITQHANPHIYITDSS